MLSRTLLFCFICLFFILCLFHTGVSAQTFQWAKTAGSMQYDMGKSVTRDLNGNIYTTGFFEGSMDVDPGPGVYSLSAVGGKDVFIQKLDAAGNFIWAKRVGGADDDQGISIATDGAGNVYAAGHFEGVVDFDPAGGIFNQTSSGVTDIFILKLSNSGNFVWAKCIGGIFWDGAASITTDAAGNIYATGYFSHEVDFDPGAGVFPLESAGDEDVFVLKLAANGQFVWAGSNGGPSRDFGQEIAVDDTGNIYLTGSFSGNADFDPDTVATFAVSSNGFYDAFVQKLNASGGLLWVRTFGGVLNDEGYGLDIDNAGYIVSTGRFTDSVDFDPGAGVFGVSAVGSADVYIQKLNPGGDFIWVRAFGDAGDDAGNFVSIDADANIYVCGYFDGSIDFDPGPGISNFTTNGYEDVFILRLDENAGFVWARTFGGNGYESAESLVLDHSGNLILCGAYSGTVDFDPGAGVFNSTSNGDHDIFVQKVSTCAAAQALNTTAPAELLICEGNAATLSATGNSSLIWYEQAAGGIELQTGNLFTTPALSDTTTFFVYDISQCSNTRTPVTVNVLPGSSSISNQSVCANQTPYDWNGLQLDSSGIYTVTFTGANGCDSSAMLNLSVSPCTVCVPEFTISYSPFYNALTESQSWIVTSGTVDILAGSKVKLDAHAGSYVQLNPGFKAAYGAVFVAQAYNGCDAGEPQKANAKMISEKVLSDEILIYPNPAHHSISVLHGESVSYIRIYDLVGKLWIAESAEGKSESMVNISGLPAGVYLIKVDHHRVVKFVKN